MSVCKTFGNVRSLQSSRQIDKSRGNCLLFARYMYPRGKVMPLSMCNVPVHSFRSRHASISERAYACTTLSERSLYHCARRKTIVSAQVWRLSRAAFPFVSPMLSQHFGIAREIRGQSYLSFNNSHIFDTNERAPDENGATRRGSTTRDAPPAFSKRKLRRRRRRSRSFFHGANSVPP